MPTCPRSFFTGGLVRRFFRFGTGASSISGRANPKGIREASSSRTILCLFLRCLNVNVQSWRFQIESSPRMNRDFFCQASNEIQDDVDSRSCLSSNTLNVLTPRHGGVHQLLEFLGR